MDYRRCLSDHVWNWSYGMTVDWTGTTINNTDSEHYHGLVTAEGTGSGECEKGFKDDII